MRKLVVLAAICLFTSCSTADKKENATGIGAATTASPASVSYPYAIGYSSKFEMGDEERAKTVLDLWKAFDNNTIDAFSNSLADTVTLRLPGTVLHGSRDSILASIKAYRRMFSALVSRVDAVMSIKSTDKNEDWVGVWGTEIHTETNKKPDSVRLHETWRFNKDGKIDYMQQYVQPFPSKK